MVPMMRLWIILLRFTNSTLDLFYKKKIIYLFFYIPSYLFFIEEIILNF